jgi:hypothetical protein
VCQYKNFGLRPRFAAKEKDCARLGGRKVCGPALIIFMELEDKKTIFGGTPRSRFIVLPQFGFRTTRGLDDLHRGVDAVTRPPVPLAGGPSITKQGRHPYMTK